MREKLITSIGGQALIEGIMMRGPKKTSVAVRTEDGSIYVEDLKVTSLSEKYKIFKLPFFRGIAGFIDSLMIGQKALAISAEKSVSEEEDEEPSKFSKFIEEHFGDKFLNVIVGIASVLGVGIGILLFLFFPTWIFNVTLGQIPALGETSFYRSIFEGVLRIVIFFLYILLCSQLKDIKRVFKYHGAEHKTIFCYEYGDELTVENVKKYKRFHPRCGTSFIVIMVLLGIFIGFFIPFKQAGIRLAIKLLCVPVLVAVGYELIRICGKYDNKLTRVISLPGVWMQRITTKEPDDDMIEVAIRAIKEVIPQNGEDIIRR